jgi:pilus assembly protein FimV
MPASQATPCPHQLRPKANRHKPQPSLQRLHGTGCTSQACGGTGPIPEAQLYRQPDGRPDHPAGWCSTAGPASGLWRLPCVSASQSRRGRRDSTLGDSQLSADSFFGASGGQRVDTTTSSSQMSGQSMQYSPSQLDAGDVDPLAEADVYLAYGRDLQAEEILKEALRADPNRLVLHQKLAEIYAKRHDRMAYASVANNVFALTQGKGPEWQRLADQGRILDPENLTYQLGGAPSPGRRSGRAFSPTAPSTALQGGVACRGLGSALAAAQAAEAAASREGPPTEPAGMDFDMDLELPADLPDTAASAAPVPSEPVLAQRTGLRSTGCSGTLLCPLRRAGSCNRRQWLNLISMIWPRSACPPRHLKPRPLSQLPRPPSKLSECARVRPRQLHPAFADTARARRRTETAPLNLSSSLETGRSARCRSPDPAAGRGERQPRRRRSCTTRGDFRPQRPVAGSGHIRYRRADRCRASPSEPEDPLATKLALAEEFNAIGDSDGARTLIEEVIAEAHGDLKAKAHSLLSQIG